MSLNSQSQKCHTWDIKTIWKDSILEFFIYLIQWCLTVSKHFPTCLKKYRRKKFFKVLNMFKNLFQAQALVNVEIMHLSKISKFKSSCF